MLIRLLLVLCCVLLPVAFAQTPPPVPPVAPVFFTTPHDPRIPAFAQFPTLAAVQDGAWSQPTTWDGGRLPTATDVVVIDGHTVTYDGTAGTCLTLGIGQGGTLRFATTAPTSFAVGTLFVGPGGTLTIGTPTTPVPPTVTAELVIRDIPLVTTPGSGVYDPSQYGTGLLVLGGTFSMVGSAKTPFVRVSAELPAGQTTLPLSAPVSGWRPGDELVLPDSRQLTPLTAKQPPQWETPTLASVSGQTATLQAPLTYAHPGAKDSLTGHLDFTPHVGNLTRNVVVRSENPAGTRGHVWLSGRAQVHIAHARFEQLGRTKTSKIQNTTYTPLGAVNVLGGNQQGRYTLHFHHLLGPSGASGPQFTVVGSVFHGGPAAHSHKWMIGLHDTHYGRIADNVMYNCAGACLATEDGSESQNIIEKNFAVRASGTSDRMGMGSEATGFWFRGVNNIVKDNVAATIMGGMGVQHCGYSLWQQGTGTVRLPLGPGVDTSVKGQYTLQSIYSLPIREFARNEVYGSPCGMTAWWVGSEWQTPRATADSVVQDLTAWNLLTSAWYNYQTHRLVLDGLVVRGDPTGFGCCNSGYQGLDYFASDLTIRHADIQGVREGISVSTSTAGIQHIEDSRIVASKAGVTFNSLWRNGASPKDLKPRMTLLENVLLAPIPKSTAWHSLEFAYNGTGVRTLVRPDVVEVKDYQQQEGDNFRAYYREQAPTFVVPQTTFNADGTPKLEGAPVAGLTNEDAWLQYGVAIAGEVVPCTDTGTRPEVLGLTCSGGRTTP